MDATKQIKLCGCGCGVTILCVLDIMDAAKASREESANERIDRLAAEITIKDRDSLTAEIEGLRKELARQEDVKTAMLAAGNNDREEQELRYKDQSETFTKWLNDVWGIVYPDAPTSWEYPAQVFRHIRDYTEELKVAPVNTEINGVRKNLSKAVDVIAEIEQMAEEDLIRSHKRSMSYNLSGTHYKYETDYLRETIRAIGLKAKGAFHTEDFACCSICGTAKDAYEPCPECNKSEFKTQCCECKRSMLVTSVKCDECTKQTSYGAGVGDSEFTQARRNVEQRVAQELAQSPGIMGATVNAPPTKGEPLTFDILKDMTEKVIKRFEDDKFDSLLFGHSPLFGFPVHTSPYVPDHKAIFMSPSSIQVLDLSPELRDARLRALEAEAERSRRIEREVKDLLKPKRHSVSINVTVETSPAFEELKRTIEGIRDNAQADVDQAVNKLLGKCKE